MLDAENNNGEEDGEDLEEEEEEVKEGDVLGGKDNRDIVDNNQAQKLTQGQIEDMKASGITGQQMIRTLIENSDTFKLRTKFSQAKYLRKKLQKYSVTFEAKKPTALELCEAYSQTDPKKILNLRSDSLALLIQLANINAESRVLLLDKTKGLIAGALIEKNVKEIMHMELSSPQLKL